MRERERESNHERIGDKKLDCREQDFILSIKRRRRKRMARRGSDILVRKKMSKEKMSVFIKVLLRGATLY